VAFERRLLPAFSISITVISINAAPAHAADPIRCTVIIDEKTGETIYRQGNCDQGFYPQSTFKLPLAMMGYDSGILVDGHNPFWTYDAKLVADFPRLVEGQ
jgi:beta-lactamase class D